MLPLNCSSASAIFLVRWNTVFRNSSIRLKVHMISFTDMLVQQAQFHLKGLHIRQHVIQQFTSCMKLHIEFINITLFSTISVAAITLYSSNHSAMVFLYFCHGNFYFSSQMKNLLNTALLFSYLTAKQKTSLSYCNLTSSTLM